MANDPNKVNVPLNITDNGTMEQSIQNAKRLNSQLRQLVKNTEALNKASSAKSTADKAAGGMFGGGEGRDYGTQRGVAGTGTGTRDFAKQAAGLGGLVHVYATFAANIYAVSTAFNALKSAADISNMTKGLEQLGAASGRNLGALSKQLIEVSDGALSVRDALAATAKGSAANLTNTQMIRLAQVAKNASLALGRDLPDAMDRLVRGVGKLEPEILDELGILVKVGEASDKYARSLGKTANSLTDFEKRQAFTNEVLEQGEKKFGDITVEANAYAKILATASNLALAGLEKLNVVLSPVVKLLSESPTALAAVISGLGYVLLKQAIPAINNWRESVTKAAEESAKKAKVVNESFTQFQKQELEKQKKLISEKLDAEKLALDKSQALQAEYAKKGIKSGKGAITDIAAKQASNISDIELAKIDAQIKAKETKAAKGVASAKAEADALRNLKAQIVLNQAAETEYANKVFDLMTMEEAHATKSAKLGSEAWQRQEVARKATLEANKAMVLSNVAMNTQIMGVRGAFSQLQKDITEKGIGGISAFTTSVRGGFAIATSAVTTFMSAFGTWFAVIGLATAALSALYEWLSTNSKEMEAFASATEASTSSVDALSKTMDKISRASFADSFSPETIQARANAIDELNNSIQSTVTALVKVEKASSATDKFVNSFKKLWGGDIQTKAAESLAKSIQATLNNALEGSAKDKFIADIAEATGIGAGDLTADTISKALSNASFDEAVANMVKLTNANDNYNRSLSKTAAASTGVSEALKESARLSDALLTSLTAFDDVGKLGVQLVNSSIAIGRAILEGPVSSLASFKKLLEDVNQLKVLSPESIKSLEKFRSEIEMANNKIVPAERSIKKLEDDLEKLNKSLQSTPQMNVSVTGGTAAVSVNEEYKILAARKRAVEEEMANWKKQLHEVYSDKSLYSAFQEVQLATFDKGAALLDMSLKNAFESAALSVQKAAATGLTGRGAGKVEYDLKVKELNIQQSTIDVSLDLLESQYQAKLAIDANTLAIEKSNAIKDREKAKPQDIPDIDAKIEGLGKSTENLIKFRNAVAKVGDDYKALIALARQYADTDPNLSSSLFSYASARAGILAKQQSLNAEKRIAYNNSILKQNAEEYDNRIAINNQWAEDLKIVSAKLNMDIEAGRISKEQAIDKKAELDIANKVAAFIGNNLTKSKEISDQLLRQDMVGTKILGTQDKLTAQAKAQAQLGEELNIIEDSRTDTLEAQSRARKDALAVAQQARDLAAMEITKEQASLADYTREVSELQRILDSRKTEAAKLPEADKTAAVDSAQKEFDANKKIVDLKREQVVIGEKLASVFDKQADEAERLNRVLDKTESFGESLVKVFGKVGSSISGMMNALARNAKAQEDLETKLLNKKLHNDAKYGKASDKARQANAQSEKEYQQDRVEADLDATIAIAANAASMFKEKTFAAKAFGAIEKGLHVAKLAMNAEEMAIKMKDMAVTLYTNGVKQVSNIATAVTAFFASLGPFGWAGIAAMFATLAAFGISGKGGGSEYSGPSSEQLQETAGTGQKYKDGKLVETGYGTLGERDQRSEAVEKSLDLLTEYTYENLEYSNKMLEALQAIRNNIGSLTTSIVRVRGLTGGPQAEAAVESKGLTGLSKAMIDITKYGIPGLLDKLTGGAVSSLVGSIFGKVTSSLKDTGIRIVGQTVGDILSKGIEASQYQVIETTKKSLFGIVKKTTTAQNFSELDADIKTNFNLVIKSLVDNVVAAADALGMGGQAVVDKINSVAISLEDISLKDLKASEIPAYLEGIIGSIGSLITKEALGDISRFQKAGEDLLTTANRVARSIQIVGLQFQQIGVSLGNMSIDAKMALIDIAGGLDAFTEQSNYFFENFLTEAEKLAPVQKALTTELARLGLSTIDTVDEFKNLILSFGQTNGISAETYTALMKVSKAFTEVYGTASDAEDKIKDAEEAMKELAEKSKDLAFEISKRLLSSEKALQLVRKKTLEELDASLRPMQEYLFALEDEATAREALATAYAKNREDLQSTIDTLGNSSKALRDFKDSLLLSKESPLTPQQRYLEAKRQFESVLAVARGPATTKDEIKARDAALSKIQSSASALLEASGVFNASSPIYTADFRYITEALTSTADSLDEQKTDAEKQLDALDKQIKLLDIINESVVSVEEAFKKYAEASILVLEKAIAAGTPLTGEQSYTRKIPAVQDLYQSILGRQADTTGLDFYSKNSATIGDIRRDLFNSPEFLSSITSVEDVYRKVLKREPDQAGLEFWKARLSEGVSMKSIIQAIVSSQEYGTIYPGLASGGIGRGLTVVGEKGPEIVNFSNPGTVFNNDQSNGMMAAFVKPLIDEVKALRAEVAQLKEQSVTNTDKAILASYIASDRNAKTISTNIAEIQDQANWPKNLIVKPD